ncbi:MAG TPA: fatty acid desaturase [Rhizomicrobium sp.]|jgi:fatty acid desaturase|nr:fatty acid desaturase [Rhizomicrobium sp.]
MSGIGNSQVSPNAARIDALLLTLAFAITLLQFFLFPFLIPVNGWTAAALIILCAVTAPLHYGLMHETMHSTLFEGEAPNARAGRLLGITFGYSWHVIRFGHLAHHAFNRNSYDRPDVLPEGKSRAVVVPVYFFNILGGQALMYVLSPLPVLLPVSTTRWILERLGDDPETVQLREAALRAFSNPERRRAIRLDLLAMTVLFAAAIWCWGAAWPVFAATLAARWCVVSLLDNAPHYGTSVEAGLNARNSRMPAIFRWLVMNQNFHGIHHHQPQTSWHLLPDKFAQSGKAPDGSWLGTVLRQFRGPRRAEDFH